MTRVLVDWFFDDHYGKKETTVLLLFVDSVNDVGEITREICTIPEAMRIFQHYTEALREERGETDPTIAYYKTEEVNEYD